MVQGFPKGSALNVRFLLLLFLKVSGGHMSIFGATGTPVLDFW